MKMRRVKKKLARFDYLDLAQESNGFDFI